MAGGQHDPLRVSEADLRRQCVALLEAHGVAPGDADTTVDVFLQAELMGEESHGLRLFLLVLERLKAGGDRAATKIDVEMDRGAVALWNANRSLGQVTAARAMALAMNKARDHGIGFVSVHDANSLTSAKYYPLRAAAEGMIGFAFTNTSRKLMPPPGGTTPVLGNNPVAMAAPAGRYGAFALDMACTAAAVERIARAREKGEPIPSGWALDRDGNETNDPAQALESLALLPFGGHKAFGLAMVHEIVTSVLSGGPLQAGESTGFVPFDRPMNTSFSLMAIDISAFMPVSEFERRMEALIESIKSAERHDPDVSILYPGERSLGEMARRKREGIPVDAATFGKLHAWARELGVATAEERN